MKPAWTANPLRVFDAYAFTATATVEALAK
jgi:hypothetical protein